MQITNEFWIWNCGCHKINADEIDVCLLFILFSLSLFGVRVCTMNTTAPNDVVYSCGYASRVHSVAFLLGNGALVFCCNHDGMVVDVVYFRSVVCHGIRVRVFCAHRNGVRVACDIRALCDILVCVYDIRVFCCILHDVVVACNDHNDDGLAYPRDVVVEDNGVYALHGVAACGLHDDMVYALHDSTVYAPDEVMDSEAPMEVCRTYPALELVLLTQLPKMTRK